MPGARASIFEGDLGRRLRVLVVDDNPRNRQIMRAMLELLDCEAHCVDSGEAAADAAALTLVDLVIMDRNLDGISGDEAARRIRKKGVSRFAAIVSWSSDPPPTLDPAIYDGALAKPIVMRELADVIAHARHGELRRLSRTGGDVAESRADAAATHHAG